MNAEKSLTSSASSLNYSIPCACVPLPQGQQAVHVCGDGATAFPGHVGWEGVHAKSPKSMELCRCEGGREKSELKVI